MRRSAACFGLLAALTLAACSEGDELGPNISGVAGEAIVDVRIVPSEDTILIPDTVRVSDRLQLKGLAIGRTGAQIDVPRYVWQSSDPTIAAVDSTGLVTPIRTGSVEITASAYRVGRAKVVILPAANRIVVTPRVDTIFVDEPATAIDDSVRIVAQAFDAAGVALTGVRYTWTSSAPAVASVDGIGTTKGIGFGTTTLTVSGNGTQATATVMVRPRTERISVQPTIDSIYVDDPVVARDTIRLTSRAFDLAGQPLLSGVRYTWQSSATGVATVDTAGMVQARTLGTATLTLRAALSQATATVAVVPVVASLSASSPVAQVLAGDTVQLTARALDYTGQAMNRKYGWTSSNPQVATVDSTGRVIFVAAGSAEFTATTAYRTAKATVTALPRQLQSVAAGNDFACGVANLGRGYCWGKGTVGQLAGRADSTCFDDPASPPGKIGCALEPKRIDGPVAFNVIAAGDSTACGISTNQQVYCWGDDNFGQIGNGSAGGGAAPRLATVGAVRFKAIDAGAAHFCAISTTDLAYCWGKDSTSQLGDNRTVNSTTPIPVVGPDGLQSSAIKFSAISAGAAHTCGLDLSGVAYCWGDNRFGAVGIPTLDTISVPIAVNTTERFVSISAGLDDQWVAGSPGWEHTCAVTVSGSMYCWGDNRRGQLGVSAPAFSPAPVLVGTGYRSVVTGWWFTCALRTDGTVNCWGDNRWGQLGRGEGNPGGFSSAPTPIVGGMKFSSISAGTRHVCGVSSIDAETYCWGSNMLGALGNQLQAAVRSTPQKVARPR